MKYFTLAILFFLSINGCKLAHQNLTPTQQGIITSYISKPIQHTNLSVFQGQVHDLKDTLPLPFVNVYLYKNEAMVKGVLTDLEGNFKFSDLEIGSYVLKIIASGYKSADVKFDLKTPSEISMILSIERIEIQVEKPVIYLYPTEKKEISVKLNYLGKLTHSYPKYPEDGWKVVAEPNGTLWDHQGMEFYGLFWEGIPSKPLLLKDGFVIEGSNTAKFLEEKLAYLGLNRREANEFIMYWLPRMENNAYNLIHFSGDDYHKQAELLVTPAPETIIRVMMLTKPLSSKIDFPLQNLSKLRKSRKGFTLVEWGGSEISTIPF